MIFTKKKKMFVGQGENDVSYEEVGGEPMTFPLFFLELAGEQ